MILDCFECKFYFLCIKMEFQKIVIFFDATFFDEDLPRFVTKKLIEIYDQSVGSYNINKEIRIKTSVLRSDLCDFNDAYIVVKGTIIVNKKTFTADHFEAPNNTAANATATNIANNHAFGEKSWFLKTMLHLSVVFPKLME